MKLIAPFIFTVLLFVQCKTGRDITNDNGNYAGNALTSVPREVLNNTHLQTLNLGVESMVLYRNIAASPEKRNYITELPAQFGNLRQLKTLSLCFNELVSLPQSFSSLNALEELDISFNRKLNISIEKNKLYAFKKLRLLNIMGTIATNADVDSLKMYIGDSLHVILSYTDFKKYYKIPD
jgi:Leucine rich repeat